MGKLPLHLLKSPGNRKKTSFQPIKNKKPKNLATWKLPQSFLFKNIPLFPFFHDYREKNRQQQTVLCGTGEAAPASPVGSIPRFNSASIGGLQAYAEAPRFHKPHLQGIGQSNEPKKHGGESTGVTGGFPLKLPLLQSSKKPK